jgi:2-polyprenyl-3-methyl-5-hydroxy-6-metoxy-1,4-benzoquinol methylase
VWSADPFGRYGGAVKPIGRMLVMPTGAHGPKRRDHQNLQQVQAGNIHWWESTPMDYASRRRDGDAKAGREWFDDQDERFTQASAHFATDRIPFDRLIPYTRLAKREVLEIGTGSGFHSELMAEAGASVNGIDITEAAVARTKERFGIKGLEGNFERWDAEQPRPEFRHRFDFVWSWGVVHHSSRTARIIRNVADWLTDAGEFRGMVYNRDSLPAILALVGRGVVKGRLLSRTPDEILWSSTDGFSARFYSPDQWRDLLMGFFERAEVSVTGQLSDILPIPRGLRRRIAPGVSPAWRDRKLAKFGSFITFHASQPIRSKS